MNNEIIAALRNSELFKSLDPASLEQVSTMLSRENIRAGRVIVNEGEPSDKLFLIVNGIVVVKKIAVNESEKILAYLMPGNTFGEVGILEGKPRSATVAALTDTEVIVVPSFVFEDLLMKFPRLGIELARLLGYYLTQTNNRITRGNKESRLISVYRVGGVEGAEQFSHQLAAKVSEHTGRPTVFIHYKDASAKGKTNVMDIQSLGVNYDVLINWNQLNFPRDSRISIVADRLLNTYDNLVIFFDDIPGENLSIIYENLSQAIVISNADSALDANTIGDSVARAAVHRDVDVFQLREVKPGHKYIIGDKTLSFSGSEQKEIMPGEAIHAFVDRLERNNRIGIFIPTTINVNTSADTSEFVSETLKFMGRKFGGATSEEAIGVWNSKDIGIVDEKVFIVHSYTTSKALRDHLNEVVEFVKSLKTSLNQESMALEINKRLTLI